MIKMKKKPQEPKRKNHWIIVGLDGLFDGKERISVYNLPSRILERAIYIFEGNARKRFYIPEDPEIFLDLENCYECGSSGNFVVVALQKEDDFKKDIEQYQKKLSEWNNWYSENKEAIEERDSILKKKKEERISKEKAKIKKQLEKLNKKLNSL